MRLCRQFSWTSQCLLQIDRPIRFSQDGLDAFFVCVHRVDGGAPASRQQGALSTPPPAVHPVLTVELVSLFLAAAVPELAMVLLPRSQPKPARHNS